MNADSSGFAKLGRAIAPCDMEERRNELPIHLVGGKSLMDRVENMLLNEAVKVGGI
jgi:hypothetical protein